MLDIPTTRSRTGLFLSYRHSSDRIHKYHLSTTPNDEEHQLLIDHHHHHHNSLPPKWVDISERVHEILTDTQQKISALERLHAKHVLPGFSDRSHEEQEIEALTTDITRDFRNCQLFIQKIPSAHSHAFPPSSHFRNEQLTAKNVQRALAAKVQDLSASFRKKQRVYMEKLQGHAIKNQDLLIASGTISLRGPDGLSAVDDDVQAASHTHQSLAHLDPSMDIRTRNRELTEIANSIASLAELFKDLSVLVIDQGTLLDSVEYNIEQTATHMQEAVKELDVATRYQRNTGRRQCIFLLSLIIFGLIIVLIFKPRRHVTLPPPQSPPIDTIHSFAPSIRTKY
ncbi:hypothetical protein AMATHDRAFT_142393 [Amanita thiersii Skay4041]|uniref:t-SNARE coiled-coil homology domain-containing protein n=1 Tax=Amanita thiersii Skay4041 TaxID=703135 RepID=A0A2A9NN14_9AGAR|nr:hypothetical protein AMATHDRAFT_142393 [Amanita thiersii Skay4041]